MKIRRNRSVYDKKIIITGASKGIGREIAKEIAAQGGIPILVARSTELLEELAEEIEVNNGICKIYPIETFSREAIAEQINTMMEKEERIHGLINNAGFGIFDSIEDLNIEDVEEMFQVNVLAGIQYAKGFLPHFLQFKGKSHIINIVSQSAKLPTPKTAGYAASKHAMLGFTNVLRQETRESSLTVTSVNLGPVKTSFFEVADKNGEYQQNVEKYMLKPEKIASKVVHSLFTNKREINMPWWMEAGSIFYRLFPGLMEKMLKSQFDKK
ncbi:SDR family NAD(P)-dependent oxidoreductase [Oceanobacillus timonensis]|uniref:SDR family NAD(P)-dependent oxidoreductase n=1 Tax=Oceanobacillus timonensis TaxID=1926285 RepID=UPI0009BB865A|nr:SDR family NAD(P)-dependent oxidoreductase [Oceanobacillus timonensis]